nr:inovirus-type Gp2 protein [uncultured Tolumonas sp.]
MNTNDALLNVLELTKASNRTDRPYVSVRYGVLRSHVAMPLFQTLTAIADAIRYSEIIEPQHPKIELFVDFFRESYLPWDISTPDWTFDPSLELVRGINNFLDEYVGYCQAPSFRRKMSKALRRCERNTLSLRNYVDDLFDVHSRLLVVRVDFHYQPEFYEELTLKRVINDRKVFLENIKQEFDELVGLCWKLEYAKQRGFHYHFIFFFDGNKARQDISLGRALGEHWVSVTVNEGSYHNCNFADKDYPEKYLGMIHYSDDLKRRALRHADYLTKNDENILAILCNGRTRIFGRMESRSRRSAAGRPRLRVSARS